MNDKRPPIEGQLADEPPARQEIARRPDPPEQAVAIFNPLDAEPVNFARQLQNRQENYDQLAMHLRGVLVAGKDFGQLHVAKGCDNKYRCENPGHFSDWTLFTSGADKILGILGLGVAYPDLQDYKRAVLKGLKLEEVIADAQILGHADQVIAVGCGACTRDEVGGSLNNMIKRAAKRARLDAVLRLPVVSALFEADFLRQVAQQAERGEVNSTTKRAQTVKTTWDTGAKLTHCPIGTKHKGKPWREIPTDYLDWLARNVADKPDVHRAAVEELSRRGGPPPAPGSSSTRTPPPPTSHRDEGPPLEAYDDHPPGQPFNDDIPTW